MEIKWIKVEEQLPPYETRILATDGYYTHLCEYCEDNEYDIEMKKTDPNWQRNWLNLDSAIHYFDNVIAWMPLPQYKTE